MAIDDLREWRDAYGRMVFTFGGDADMVQRKAYARAIDGIPVAIIEAAIDALINEAAAGRKFYPMPTPPDLKGMCAKVMAAKRKAAAALHLENCDHDSHFIEIDGKNQRCPCWDRAQQAMLDVGQAIALPPAREDSEVA